MILYGLKVYLTFFSSEGIYEAFGQSVIWEFQNPLKN